MSANAWAPGGVAAPGRQRGARCARCALHPSWSPRQALPGARPCGSWLAGGTLLLRHARAEPRAVGLSALAEAERSFDMEDGEREGDEGWRAATWPDAFDRNFARGDLLGSGSFGTVYRCVERASGDDEYAVKVIPKTREGADPARILMRIREEVRGSLCTYLTTSLCKFSRLTCTCKKLEKLGIPELPGTRRWTRCRGCRRAQRPFGCAASMR